MDGGSSALLSTVALWLHDLLKPQFLNFELIPPVSGVVVRFKSRGNHNVSEGYE